MGLTYRGIPEQDALNLACLYGCKNYVETGTHAGRSLKWAVEQRIFDKCIGIEIDPTYALTTIQKVGLSAHVLVGDSLSYLPQLASDLDAPTLFWLDAHWSPDLHWSEPRVICPLLDEVRIIAKRPFQDVLLIDDARLLGHDGWPSLVELMDVLLKKFTMTVTNDYVRVIPK